MRGTRPWWQVSNTPWQGLVLGALNMALGLFWVTRNGNQVWVLVMGSWFLFAAAAYFGSTIALHLRSRLVTAKQDPPSRRAKAQG